MFLTNTLNFSLTAISFIKKAKADRVVVLCKSVASGHGRMKARQRLAEKLEFIDYDPTLQLEVLYKEDKKVRSIRDKTIVRVTNLRVSNRIGQKWPTLCHEP